MFGESYLVKIPILYFPSWKKEVKNLNKIIEIHGGENSLTYEYSVMYKDDDYVEVAVQGQFDVFKGWKLIGAFYPLFEDFYLPNIFEEENSTGIIEFLESIDWSNLTCEFAKNNYCDTATTKVYNIFEKDGRYAVMCQRCATFANNNYSLEEINKTFENGRVFKIVRNVPYKVKENSTKIFAGYEDTIAMLSAYYARKNCYVSRADKDYYMPMTFAVVGNFEIQRDGEGEIAVSRVDNRRFDVWPVREAGFVEAVKAKLDNLKDDGSVFSFVCRRLVEECKKRDAVSNSALGRIAFLVWKSLCDAVWERVLNKGELVLDVSRDVRFVQECKLYVVACRYHLYKFHHFVLAEIEEGKFMPLLIISEKFGKKDNVYGPGTVLKANIIIKHDSKPYPAKGVFRVEGSPNSVKKARVTKLYKEVSLLKF